MSNRQGRGERRLEPRMLCADLMSVEWVDAAGRARRDCANLEDISASGACLQLEGAVPVDTALKIVCGKAELRGRVRYCVFRETGYFLGVQFETDCKWDRRGFRPKHLLDPRNLARKRKDRSGPA